MSAGLHHVTAICRDGKRNVRFYTDDLGLRLIKKTVNFDRPDTWHLYYGDETGRPGSVLTFFVWDELASGREGAGMASEVAFMIPRVSLGYWAQRLATRGIAHDAAHERFGEGVLALRDPDGMRVALVGVDGAAAIAGWSSGDVPREHAVRGLRGITLTLAAAEPTAQVLSAAFGFQADGHDGGVARYRAPVDELATVIDVRTVASAGHQGAGSIHHVAFRAADDGAQARAVLAVKAYGLAPTEQIDRCYFRSVYFREPGGVLFEIATDDPGFTVDEPKAALGSAIKLPPWYEPRRAEIVAALPSLG